MNALAIETFQLDTQQQKAVELGCDVNNRITYTTGPAGTGKTTIARQINDAFIKAGYRVVACAPTGKAARRITEATGIPAYTIHALLEYPHPGERDEKTGKPLVTTEPKRDRNNPIEYDVVLADEYAMVNTEVHRNLVDALPRGGLLRCFGDINQLAPIERIQPDEYRSPFQQIIDKFQGVKLEQIHRQGEGSGIVLNASLVLKGRMPTRKDDFSLKVTDFFQDALIEFINEHEGLDFKSLDNQIIVPGRKNNCGSVRLNAYLQNILNPSSNRLSLERHKWASDESCSVAIGDKILQTQNNYTLSVMNGEVGVIEDITEYGELDVNFGDRNVIIPPELAVESYNKRTDKADTVMINPQRDLELAYAVTTHKCQGSEFQNIVYLINKAASFNLCRRNLYTAITRARKSVHLIADQRALALSVQRAEQMAMRGK